MARILREPQALVEAGQFGFFEDFLSYTDTQFWTKLAADSGSSVAITSSSPTNEGGVIKLTTGATQENEVNIHTTNGLFLVALNRPIVVEAYVQFAQANTNNIEVAFGLADITDGANLMVDALAGPRTSGNQILMYTVGGDTNWHCQARNGTSVQDQASSTPATPDTNFHRLRIEVQDMSQTQMICTYQVDGVKLKPSTSQLVYGDISHTLNIASSALMKAVLYVKAGSGSSEVAVCDYFGAWQLRNRNAQMF